MLYFDPKITFVYTCTLLPSAECWTNMISISGACGQLICNFNVYVGFEVLTAASMKMAVFWVVASCSVVEVWQRSSP
jgi:hypothetical protein